MSFVVFKTVETIEDDLLNFLLFVAKLHWHKLHLDKSNVNSEWEFLHTSESKFQTINIVKTFQHRKYLYCQIKIARRI